MPLSMDYNTNIAIARRLYSFFERYPPNSEILGLILRYSIRTQIFKDTIIADYFTRSKPLHLPATFEDRPATIYYTGSDDSNSIGVHNKDGAAIVGVHDNKICMRHYYLNARKLPCFSLMAKIIAKNDIILPTGDTVLALFKTLQNIAEIKSSYYSRKGLGGGYVNLTHDYKGL